ncbi:flagellar M-ring protein FliF C-terminal domain-containing protein [Pseudoroseomonas cervicalis]|uniref:flagellar M-ring protein FliF C-terminal domain-containing protein n=1 Tax=Teichococcus cervicalis TaxID=204525 RepID=UPI0035E7B86B
MTRSAAPPATRCATSRWCAAFSVAVLVDGVWEPGEAGGAARFRERTPQEMERISALVRGAIGFNETRGDRLEVVSLRFAEPVWGSDGESQRGPLGLPPLTPTLTARLLESALYALVALLAVFFVGRPVAKRLVAGMTPRPLGALAGAAGAAGMGGALPAPEGAQPGAPGSPAPAARRWPARRARPVRRSTRR